MNNCLGKNLFAKADFELLKIAENSLDLNKQLFFHKDHPTAQATFNQAHVGVKKDIKKE